MSRDEGDAMGMREAMSFADNHARLLHPLFHAPIFALSLFLLAGKRTLRGDIATRVSQDSFGGSSDDRRQRLRRFSTAPRQRLSSRLA